MIMSFGSGLKFWFRTYDLINSDRFKRNRDLRINATIHEAAYSYGAISGIILIIYVIGYRIKMKISKNNKTK